MAKSRDPAAKAAQARAKVSPGRGWFLKVKSKFLKAPRGRNLQESTLLASVVTAVGTMLEIFEEDPSKALHALSSLQAATVGPVTKDATDRWPGYTKFKRIPKYWCATYMIARSEGRISQNAVTLLDTKHPNALKAIFYFDHQINDNTEIPAPMLDKAVMATVLKKRSVLLGNRLTKILGRKDIWDLETGDFNIECLNSFDIIVQGGVVSAVQHISGARAEMKHKIDADFVVEQHLVDTNATLVCDIVRIRLVDLFRDRTGPVWAAHADNQKQNTLLSIADKYVSDVNKAKPTTLEVQDAPAVLADSSAHRKEQALEKAREALAEVRQNGPRRVIRVKMPPPQ